ncbi:hypothetical protein PybrP1_005494 [[Pythium] brassicae (nom. inval.)]|nr:hypothetical protein PybrP1_005494 [[Pythium] brassicae (nom. inval.)]
MGGLSAPLPLPPQGAARFAYVAFAILQCFLGAGIIFGWTSIIPVLEQERVYGELCAPDERVCEAQSEKLHFAFTIAGSSSMCSNLVLGLFFDRFGPRYTKVLSLALLIVGALLMGHARYGAPVDVLLPGMALIGFAGPGVQLSGIHLSNLFPDAKALVTCCVVGALQLSFFIFTLFGLLYAHAGASLAAIFRGYALVLLLTLLGSWALDPDAPFEAPAPRRRRSTAHELLSPMRLPTVFNDEEASLLSSTPELHRARRQRSRSKFERYDSDDSDADDRAAAGVAAHSALPRRSFRTQARSAPFVLMCFFFAVQSLWCNFFIGSVSAQLRWKQLPERDVSALLADLALLLPGSVVFIPVVGYLLEACGYTLVTLLCTGAALGFTALLALSTARGLLVAAFVLYTLFRTILFAVLFAYLGQTFGFRHFGALTGIAFCVGAGVGLLQTPLAALGDFATIGCIQFVSLLATLVLPLTVDLNRQLNEEAKRVDQHLFFGPQQAVFEGDRTRVIHGERKIQKNNKRFWLVSEPLSMDRDSTTSLIGFPTEPPPKQGLASVTSSLSAAGRFIGQKCDNYSLCESCYQSGIHGYEDSDLLKNVREDFALRNVTDMCRRKVPEKVFEVLLKTVCRGQVDKFNFLATWICAVVLEQPIHELAVRGIEIPHLDQDTRTTLVSLLTPVLAERTDLEVCMEWFCPHADEEHAPSAKRREETLRIWVATDKDSKSPFVIKAAAPSKDADTESDGSAPHSPGPASPSAGEPSSPEGTPPTTPVSRVGSGSFGSPPASPVSSAHEKVQERLSELAVTPTDKLVADHVSDDESDSVKSDIAPRKVDGVSQSGEPSEGIAM